MRPLFALAGLALVSVSGFAQSGNSYQFNKKLEAYCYDNPRAPVCTKSGPITLGPDKTLGLYKPKQAPSAVVPRPVVMRTPVAPVALEDWRFSHPSPAVLLSINIGSLLRSPILTTMFSAFGLDAKTAEIENARTAMSDVGQVLVSVAPYVGASPSVLMLAKGNMDGAFGALLRSGEGMQVKRLDAITTLVGEARSLEMASLRMRSTYERTTLNSLQQAGTLEALKYDAWIGVDPRRLASVASAFGASQNPTLNQLAVLRGLSIGLYLRDQIRLELELDAPSADIANRMLAAHSQLEAKQQAGRNMMGGEVWASVEGTKFKFIEIVDARGLKNFSGLDAATAQMIGGQIAPLLQALAKLGPARQTANAAPRPPQGAIVIQGLATPNR